MVTIKQQLVTSRLKTYSGINGKKYITIHETGNSSKGSNAQAHANLQTKGFTASWHWTVDDTQAIQSFPHNIRCWHAGDAKSSGNYDSIGIEICVNSDGDFKKAIANAAELVKKIMKDENIPIQNVVQHNKWSGKNCPANLRNGAKGVNWGQFIDMVREKEVVVIPDKDIGRYDKAGEDHINGQKFVTAMKISNGEYPKKNVTREQVWTMLERMHMYWEKNR